MAGPYAVEEPGGAGEPGEEQQNGKKQYTATISAVGNRGRRIYIYLSESDSLQFKDQPTGSKEPSYIRVEVDMEGHRHWNVHLSADDVLETGRLLPPPPPPPPGGGG